ncbi:MAG: DUF4129 domain-containing protein [Gaiellaceae bacterium]
MQSIPQGHARSLRVAGVLLALLVLLAVVAFASRTGFGHSSNATPTPSYVSWAMSVFLILFVVMVPVAVYAYSIQMREFRVQNKHKSMQARIARSLGMMFVVFGLAGLIMYFRRHSDLFSINAFLVHHGTGAGRKGAHGGPETYKPTFQWPVLWVSLVVLAAAVGWYLWARAHREELPLDAERTVADDVAESIDDAIEDLQAEPDARRAVIAAYARMEGVFARHGLRRIDSETPTEYLRRLLLGLTTRVDAVRRLTGLFEQAKFSDHTIDGGMKQEAIDALRLIRDDLQTVRP